MITPGERITVFGGSGFVGRYLVRRLASDGWVVRVAVRDTVAAAFVKTAGLVGQIVPMRCNVLDDDTVAAATEGADAVVNLVGVINVGPFARESQQAVHVEAAARIARAARAAGAKRLIHMSAIGAAPDAPTRYGVTKYDGELAVRAAFPDVTIFRPSIVVGPEDDFFNRFAALSRLPVFFPLVGGGRTRFQPVYVGDVAAAIHKALGDRTTVGRVYELGGPRMYTLRELMELMLRIVGRRKRLMSVPFGLVDFAGAILQMAPGAPLTRDMVKMMETDNLVAGGAAGFTELGLQPQAIEAILPTYLDMYRPGGRFAARRLA